MIKTADHTFCATLFEQLVQIVAIVKAQIAPYVDDLLEVSEYVLMFLYFYKMVSFRSLHPPPSSSSQLEEVPCY